MKNKILVLITLILLPIAVISFYKKETNFNLSKNENLTVKLKDKNSNKISELELEEYIIGVIAAEMPASFHEEALKAQAVAARSYAYYKISNTKKEYNLVSDISDQAYITKEDMKEKWKSDYIIYYNKIKKAVNNTKNEILTYNGEVIRAYYFSMSNGYTEDASLVFKEEPYLESVESSWDNESIKNYEVTKKFKKSEFCNLIQINCDDIIINEIEKSKTNRVNKIIINNKEFSGIEFRKLLSLRSTDFNITLSKEIISITTYGYGHGVGMSQYGANGMAKEGKTYQEILNHYYKNIKIDKI